MVFTSYLFVFYFLPVVLLGYYALPRASRWRNAWLLLTSYVFYGWWNPRFVLLMLGVTVVSYAAGWGIAREGATSRQRRAAMAVGVALNLATLGFFKYFVFLQSNLNTLFTLLGGASFSIWEIALPIGISFYVFHAISYIVDVYRGTAPPSRSFADFACYIALFPQSVAGPIIRYNTVEHDLRDRQHSGEQFASGVALFMVGFAKKVLIANPLGPVADAAFGAQAPGPAVAWLGALAYALQIYFDFSGYSDMAVGLGRMFGFEFMQNFNAPYRAASITDFWRRWHISLSTFLRDYLYIPLGGNRLGERRTYVNLATVMLLGGLWHGANWTFLAWGAYHGALLSAERWAGRQPFYAKLPHALRVGATFLLVLGSWVLFRAATLPDALRYFAAMLGQVPTDATSTLLAAQLFSLAKQAPLCAGLLLLCAPQRAHFWSREITWPKLVVAVPAFVAALLLLFSQSANPFLYFQF